MSGYLDERDYAKNQRDYSKEYYYRNREKIIKRVRERQVERGDEFREKVREYYHRNIDIIKEKRKIYREKRKDKNEYNCN